MARLKNNGTTVLRGTKGRLDWRVMSNGAVLSKRAAGGGFKKVGKVVAGLTFATFQASLEAADWTFTIEAREWLDLEPAPTRRVMRKAPAGAGQEQWVSSRNPGLLRARVAQGK
jgi:hypothetical protein